MDKAKGLLCSEFHARIIFSCGNCHDTANSITAIPEVGVQLSEWQVTLHLNTGMTVCTGMYLYTGMTVCTGVYLYIGMTVCTGMYLYTSMTVCTGVYLYTGMTVYRYVPVYRYDSVYQYVRVPVCTYIQV